MYITLTVLQSMHVSPEWFPSFNFSKLNSVDFVFLIFSRMLQAYAKPIPCFPISIRDSIIKIRRGPENVYPETFHKLSR
jgi:hypothetical protein